MIKSTLLTLFMALLFTGCVERGHHVIVPTQQSSVLTNTTDTDQVNTISLQEVTGETIVNDESNIEDSTQNNIAGILIIIIGIIILL